jgi:hypothetical protein
LFAALGLLVVYGVAAQQGGKSSASAAAQPHDVPVAAVQPAVNEQASPATEPAPAAKAADPGAGAPTQMNAPATQPASADATKNAARSTSRANLRTGEKAPTPAAPPISLAKAIEPPKEAPAPAAPMVPAAKQPDPPGLAGAIKRAAGPLEQATPQAVVTAAPQIRGDIPEVPAQGAIQGALGSQRQAARACLADFDTPSRAIVVFASTGNVQSVSVTGPAAGTKAEGCIRSAFARVSVGPFRRATFSVPTTVSPP